MKAEIVIGTHSFTVISHEHKMTNALSMFSKKFTITELVTDYKGNTRSAVKSRFVGGNKFMSEFIFSINALTDFLHTVKIFGYGSKDFNIENNSEYFINKVNLKLTGDKIARDYQEKFIDVLSDKDSKDSYLLGLDTGRGKALPVSTPVRTIDGWSTMGDICINDKIIGRDGKITKVLNVYPQGIRDMFKITFEDGREIRADGDHLWAVETKTSRSIMKTKEIKRRMKHDVITIDLIIPEDISKNNLAMDCYLRGQTVLNLNVTNKFLLEEIMEAPRADREDFLNGIIYAYSINDNKIVLKDNTGLAINIVKLIHSVGGKASIRSVRNKDTIEFTLNESGKTRMKIERIVKSDPEDAVCIAVDNKDKQFVVDGFIPTHNTFISASVLTKLKQKVMIYILPKYIDKWIADCQELMKITRDEIYTIQGSADLKKLMVMTKKELKQYKIIIASNRTMYFYFKEYENTPFLDNFTYPILPKDLKIHLGLGIMLIDEVHQEFDTVFKGITYLDIKKVIALSATLITNDKHLSKIYSLMFPKANRLSEDTINIYKNFKAIAYSIRDVRSIKYLAPGNRGYSQIKFEYSILNNGNLKHSYLEMITYYTYHSYVTRKKKGEKLLIYAASINMCVAIVAHLKKKFKDLDIRKFTGGDHYDDVIEPDIRVTTLGKAGAAIDIKGLITTIQTINTNSPQMNSQSAGRTRDIPGRDVYYIYLYCKDIRAHVKYHNNRQQLFYESSKTYTLDEYDKRLLT